MQQTRSVEIGTGLFVLLGFAALFFLTTQTTGSENFSGNDVYAVTARFENVGSLKNRAPVSMSGVTIGRVIDVRFDPEMLNAEVTFVIDSRYDQIPEDSDASILTAGLLGSGSGRPSRSAVYGWSMDRRDSCTSSLSSPSDGAFSSDFCK